MLKGVKIAICTVAAMLLIAAVTTSVKAATRTIPDTGIEWEIVDDTLYVTYTGSGSSVIPDYTGYGPWGSGNNGIKKVVIGSGITEIGKNAFHDLYDLESIKFQTPSKVTKIGYQAFASQPGCNTVITNDIVIPNGVVEMDDTAFGGREYSGGKIVLPSSLNPSKVASIFIFTVMNDVTIVLDNPNFATKDLIQKLFYLVDGASSVHLQVPAEKLDEYRSAVALSDLPIFASVTPLPKKQGSGSNANAKPKKKVSIDLEEEEEEPEIIDYDTYKSDYPSGTIITISKEDKSIWSDMKAHPTDEKNLLGQKFLMYNFCGPDAKEIITKDIFYPTVGTEEKYDGQKRILTWRNLPNTTEGPLTAVVYNEKDKAYVIKGFVDKNGTAIFYDFIYRAASTITIVSQ